MRNEALIEEMMEEKKLRVLMLKGKGAFVGYGNEPEDAIMCSVEESVQDRWEDDVMLSKIKDASNAVMEYEGIPYYITIKDTPFGTMGSVFYVSKYKDEWKYDREELLNGYTHAYVMNYDVPEFSEFGSICYDIDDYGMLRRTDI